MNRANPLLAQLHKRNSKLPGYVLQNPWYCNWPGGQLGWGVVIDTDLSFFRSRILTFHPSSQLLLLAVPKHLTFYPKVKWALDRKAQASITFQPKYCRDSFLGPHTNPLD